MLEPARQYDARGFFSETYSRRALHEVGIDVEMVQDNHSLSVARGVVRGLHFQIGAAAQDKLIRVSRGAAFDVAVDLRHRSPTYGKWAATVLSAENWRQVFIPKGFAHGFCSLEPNTELLYKVSAYYAPGSDKGVVWNDPDIGIEWPVLAAEITCSERDADQPRLADLPPYFSV